MSNMNSEFRARSPKDGKEVSLNCFLCLKPAATSTWFANLAPVMKNELMKYLVEQLVRKPQTLVAIPEGFLDHLGTDFPFCEYCGNCVERLWEYEEDRRRAELKISKVLSDMEKKVAGVDINSMRKVYGEMLQARGHTLPFIRLRTIIFRGYQNKLKSDQSCSEIEEDFGSIKSDPEPETSAPVEEFSELTETLVTSNELGELPCEIGEPDGLYDFGEEQCASLEQDLSVNPTGKGGKRANDQDTQPSVEVKRAKGRMTPTTGMGIKVLSLQNSASTPNKSKRRSSRASKTGIPRKLALSFKKSTPSTPSGQKKRGRGASTIIYPVRLPQNPKFMVALSAQDAKEIGDLVSQLGGSISTLRGFDKSCCGVIASCLGPGQKIAGCLALGKPLLKMEYIEDCWRSDRFIPIEEWYVWESDNEQLKTARETAISLGFFDGK